MSEFAFHSVIFLVTAYVALNLSIYFARMAYFKPTADYTPNGDLLVVVAHQDDETIVAGGAIQRTICKGGDVHVVYTVDGVNHNPNLSAEELEKKIVKRETQAVAALAMCKVPTDHIHFLRYENEEGLKESGNVMQTVDWLIEKICDLEPCAIITCSYEGGHVDHDMTNYIVANAARLAGFPHSQVFEAPEYNRYYLRDSLTKFANRLLAIKLPNPPRFIPADSKGYFLEMTPRELAQKRAMFEAFEDWDPPSLIRAWGFPDQFRVLPEYDYASGPYDRTKTVRHWFARLRYRGTQEPFTYFRSLTIDDYRALYGRVGDALSMREIEGP